MSHPQDDPIRGRAHNDARRACRAAEPGTGALSVWTAALGLLLLASQAPAEQWLLGVDAGQTTISFTLGATLHEVDGSLELSSGQIRVDPATGRLAGEIVLDATSADTTHEGRDRDMHAKVLESEKYPVIVWKPRQLVGELSPGSEATVEVLGTIAIHGGEHEIVVPATVRLGDGEWSADAALKIPYVEWGMKDPSKFVLRVAKVVEVEVKAGGALASTGGAPAEPE